MQISYVGDGTVDLLAGGGKCFTDIAARIVASDRAIESIVNSEYCPKVVRNILESGHLAATEFDWYVFAVSGYSRVTEVQLVRKRMASFMISSGRSHIGKREFDMCLPYSLKDVKYQAADGKLHDIRNFLEECDSLYEQLIEQGIPEEDARYIKPQATTFKAIIGMNAHALIDFFARRCCNRAQDEIRDMAWKMLVQCRKANLDLFRQAGPPCQSRGYCPENSRQCDKFKGMIPTHNDVLKMITEKYHAN